MEGCFYLWVDEWWYWLVGAAGTAATPDEKGSFYLFLFVVRGAAGAAASSDLRICLPKIT